MMKKKRILFLSVMVMLICVFAGCNKIPTAEELVTNSLGASQETVDMDVIMNIAMSAESEGISMDMTMDMDANVKSNNKVAYTEGKVTIGMLGMEVSQDVKGWTDYVNGTTYAYMSMYDSWIYEEMAEELANEELSTEEAVFNVEVFEELLLAEVADEDTEYVVTAVINLGNAYEIMGMDLDELAGMTEDMDMNNISMDVTMRFDRETEALKTMSLVAREDALASMSTEGAVFETLNLEMTMNEVSEEFVFEIPASVKEEAISLEELGSTLQGLY